eukprot:403343359
MGASMCTGKIISCKTVKPENKIVRINEISTRQEDVLFMKQSDSFDGYIINGKRIKQLLLLSEFIRQMNFYSLHPPEISIQDDHWHQRGGLQPLQGKKYQRNMTHKHNHVSMQMDNDSHASPRSRGSHTAGFRHGQTIRSQLSNMNIQVTELQNLHASNNNNNADNQSLRQSEIISIQSSQVHVDFQRMNSSLQNIQKGPGQNSSIGSMPGSPDLISMGSFRRSESKFKKQSSRVSILKLQNTMKGDSIGMNTPLFQGQPIQETDRSSLRSSEFNDADPEEQKYLNQSFGAASQFQRQTSIYPQFQKQLSGFHHYVTQYPEKKKKNIQITYEDQDEDQVKNDQPRRYQTQITIEKLEEKEKQVVEAKQDEVSQKQSIKNEAKPNYIPEIIEPLKLQPEEQQKVKKPKKKLEISNIEIRDIDDQNKPDGLNIFSPDTQASIKNNSTGSVKMASKYFQFELQNQVEVKQDQSKDKSLIAQQRRFSKSASMDIVERFLQDQQRLNTQNDKNQSESSSQNLQVFDTQKQSQVFSLKRRSQMLHSQAFSSSQKSVSANEPAYRRAHTVSHSKKKRTKLTKHDRESLNILEKIYDQILRPGKSQKSSQSSQQKLLLNERQASQGSNRKQYPQAIQQNQNNFDQINSLLQMQLHQQMNIGNSPMPQKKLSSNFLAPRIEGGTHHSQENQNNFQKQFSFNMENFNTQSKESDENLQQLSDSLQRQFSHQENGNDISQQHQLQNNVSNDFTIQIFSATEDFDMNNQYQRYHSMLHPVENKDYSGNQNDDPDIMLPPSTLLHYNTIIEVPEEDQKSSLAASDKNTGTKKSKVARQGSLKFSKFGKKNTTRSSNQNSNEKSNNFSSVDPNQSKVKIYDLIPKTKLIKMFRRVSEEIGCTANLIDKHQKSQSETLEKVPPLGQTRNLNIMTQTSDSSSINNIPIHTQHYKIGSGINFLNSNPRSHESLEEEQKSVQVVSEKLLKQTEKLQVAQIIPEPIKFYDQSREDINLSQLSSSNIVIEEPKRQVKKQIPFFPFGQSAPNTPKVSSMLDAAKRLMKLKEEVVKLESQNQSESQRFNQTFDEGKSKVLIETLNKGLKQLVNNQSKLQISQVKRSRENSMIIDSSQKNGRNTPSNQGRNLIRSVKKLAQNTDNLEKLPIIAQEARLNNLRNLLMRQFGDSIRMSLQENPSINQRRKKNFRDRRRTAFTNSNASLLVDSHNDSRLSLMIPNDNQILDQDSRIRINFLNNNYNNNNNYEFSPCSYTTPQDFNNDMQFARRTYSPTSSGQTQDNSLRFGLKDFNPGDFTYELQNIIKVSGDTIYEPSLMSSRSRDQQMSSYDYNTLNINASPKGKYGYSQQFRPSQLGRLAANSNDNFNRNMNQFNPNFQTNQISSFNSHSSKNIVKSSFLRNQRKQSLPPQYILQGNNLLSSESLLDQYNKYNRGGLPSQRRIRDSPSDASKMDNDTIKTKFSSFERDQIS